MTTIKQQLITWLETEPPGLVRTTCELCGCAVLLTIANHDRYGLPVNFVICRRCGLVVLNPRWDQAAYNRFYTDFYHELLVESGVPIAFDNWQERFELMARATGLNRRLPPSPRVLEIGGGEGQLAAFIQAQYGAQVVVVEPNAREAAQARAKGFETHARVFEQCHFEPASFDLVVLMRTVDHLIDASQTFTQIRALLKAGGAVLLDGVDYFRRMAFRHNAVTPLKIDHCYYFSPETLPALLQRAGLQPTVTDLVTIPGQIVVLAHLGAAGAELRDADWIGGEQRFLEWERLANRPLPVQPLPFARFLRTEFTGLSSVIRRRFNGQKE